MSSLHLTQTATITGTFVVSVVLNGTIIGLCLSKTAKDLGVYRLLILMLSAADIAMSTSLFILQPWHKNFVVYVYGPLAVFGNYPICKFGYGFMIACSVFMVLCLCAMFWYRHSMFTDINAELKLTTGRLCLVYGILGLIATTSLLLNYNLVHVSPAVIREMAAEKWANVSNDSDVCLLIRMPELGRSSAPLFVIFMVLSMVGGYAVMLYYGWKIWKYMKSTANDQTSNRTMKLQKRLTAALFVQAALPTLTLFLPFVLVLTGVMGILPQFKDNVVMVLNMCTLAWNPVLDAIVTLWFVRPFRRVVLQLVPGLSNQNQVAAFLPSSTNHRNK